MALKEYIATIAVNNKGKLWAITTFLPFSLLLSAIVLALYGPGDTMGFLRVFIFFLLISSIPSILSFWSLKESEGHGGTMLLKGWRLLSTSMPLALLGFGMIFIIKLDAIAVVSGVIYSAAAIFSLYCIWQAYGPMVAEAKKRRLELIKRIRKQKKTRQGDGPDKDALRRHEAEVVKRAMERIQRKERQSSRNP